MKKIIYIFTVIVAISIFSSFTKGDERKKLPQITLKNLAGETVETQSIVGQGKPVLFAFWATWCAPCKKELDNMAEYYEEWQEKYGLTIVAISVDDARTSPKIKPFVDSKGWTYDIYLDVNSDSRRSLGYSSIPFSILIDGEGNIIKSHSGYIEGDELVLADELEEYFGKK
jgi:thiol-disulfide isomerase/thioredoxin